jgi:hypothetical protein
MPCAIVDLDLDAVAAIKLSRGYGRFPTRHEGGLA